eukprot:1710726-Rhodomonas_salina.1
MKKVTIYSAPCRSPRCRRRFTRTAGAAFAATARWLSGSPCFVGWSPAVRKMQSISRAPDMRERGAHSSHSCLISEDTCRSNSAFRLKATVLPNSSLYIAYTSPCWARSWMSRSKCWYCSVLLAGVTPPSESFTNCSRLCLSVTAPSPLFNKKWSHTSLRRRATDSWSQSSPATERPLLSSMQ